MVLIPEGEFTFGIEANNKINQFISNMTLSLNAQPIHKIYLNAFLIDKYEVTYKSFRQFKSSISYIINKDNEPIRGVTWYEADAYCLSKGKRLPTEIEWEKAARGRDARLFVWGSEFIQKNANFGKQVQSVGSFLNDTSVYGIMDMNGNVSEWTANWYEAYINSKFKDKLYGKNVKVLRGGSFHKMEHGFTKEFAMIPFRNFAPPSDRFWDTGFRCAKSL